MEGPSIEERVTDTSTERVRLWSRTRPPRRPLCKVVPDHSSRILLRGEVDESLGRLFARRGVKVNEVEEWEKGEREEELHWRLPQGGR